MTDVLVLGNDFDYEQGTIGQGTEKRCIAAVHYARTADRAGKPVRLIFAAGSFPRMRGDTMAQHMADYVRSRSRKISCPVLVNTTDPNVLSTIAEIRWAVEALGYDVRDLFIVTNARHYKRAKLIAWYWFGIRAHHVCSLDQTPLWHEVLAYAKLSGYLLGFGRVLEQWRRHYREW